MKTIKVKLLAVFLILGLSLVLKNIIFQSQSVPKPTSPNSPLSISKPSLAPIQFQPIYGQVVRHGLRSKPKVALTFDADMTYAMQARLQTGKVSSYYNQKIIDLLTAQNIPATIFMTGLWAKNYPKVSKTLAENPLFEIGNHSYSHSAFNHPCFKLPPLGESQKEEEFKLSQETILKTTGSEPKLFRFPGGCYQKQDLELAQKYGLTVIGWDVNSRDAFNVDKNQITQAVKKETQPGSIIVLHLHGGKNAPATAEALPEIIALLKEKGYNFVKVSELLKDLETNL